MHVEVSIGLNFIISYMYNKLPRRRVDCFAEELEKEIKKKFDGHWYPDKPFKGSAFRSIKASGEKVDPVMELAAVSSAVDMAEIQDYLPKDLTIWIDPSEVSYRIGEKGVVKILYSDRKMDELIVNECVDNSELQKTGGKSFNPEAQSFRPIESMSTSLNNLSLSPGGGSSPTSPWGSPSPTIQQQQQQQHQGALSSGSSPINSLFTRGNNHQTFTAASFAQTKFGSTKLKSHAKRPSRLSPTEFNSFIKHRAVVPNHWMNGVGAVSPVGLGGINPLNGLPSPSQGFPAQHSTNTLSPRDPRQEFMERQQRLLLLQQQQQLQEQKLQVNALQNNQNLFHTLGGSLGDIYPAAQSHQSHQQLSPNNSHFQTNGMTSLLSGGGGNNDTNLLRMKCPSDLIQPGITNGSSPILGGNSGGAGNGSQNTVNGHPSSSAENNTGASSTGNQNQVNDNATWSSLPPYAHLQHLLVAN